MDKPKTQRETLRGLTKESQNMEDEFTRCCGSYSSEAGCCVGLEEEEE